MTTADALRERLRTLKLPPLTGWRRTAAWVALGVFLFACFLAWTFPYDAVRARIAAEADAAGLFVRIDSMGPAFLGVSAHGVRVAPKGDGTGTPPPPLVVDRVTLRPSLWPWGVGFSAALFGGEAEGALGTGSAPRVHVAFERLSFRKAGLQGLTGVDAEGTVSGDVTLDVPAGPRGGDPDLAQASGHLRVTGTDLRIVGGTATVPLMGQPTPIDLPPVALGTLEAELPIDKGVATVKTLRLAGADLEAQASGTVRLARALAYAEPDVTFRLKLLPDFSKRLGIIGGAFTTLPVDPGDPAFRNAKLTGYLGKPVFRPGR